MSRKKWSVNDIKEILKECDEKMESNFANVPVRISARMTKCKGMFSFTQNKNGITPVDFAFAKTLVDGRYSEEVVRDVIIHEYIHCFINVKTKKNQGHNSTFKRYCRYMGISDETYFNAKPEIEVEKEKPKATKKSITSAKKYEVFCTCCGKIVAHRNVIKKGLLDNYKSSCCTGKLGYKIAG